jgi:hypothetical protein
MRYFDGGASRLSNHLATTLKSNLRHCKTDAMLNL